MTRSHKILVWDPLIRLFHWLLVAGFGIAWYTREGKYELHLMAGYGIIGLLGFRLLWGLIGPTHARFIDFVRGPRDQLRYIRSLFERRSKRYLGHNPAGGMMILLLLATLFTVTLSGVALDGAENWSGPLADIGLFRYKERILQIHVWSTDSLLILIPLHLLGVLQASLLHRENLVWSMISGYKRQVHNETRLQ